MDLFIATLTLGCLLLPHAIAGIVPLPSYPLAVRSPYLSTWVPGEQVLACAATAQPEFWSGDNLTWPVLARVNGKTYSLFGVPDTERIEGLEAATTVGVSFTSSHSLFNVTTGTANFTLDFFSPVLPHTEDYLRQSLPYSYLTVNVTGAGPGAGKAKVQILSGIDYTWTAQGGRSNLTYSWFGRTGLFRFNNPDEVPFTEHGEFMATHGSVVFATTVTQNAYRGCGEATSVFSQFMCDGTVVKLESCQGTDLAVLARDVGTVDKYRTASATFAVGFDRKNSINYLGKPQTSYHHTRWPTIREAVDFFLEDYNSVVRASRAFDDMVRSSSENISGSFGEQYADIVEASIRQLFGAMELTVHLPS